VTEQNSKSDSESNAGQSRENTSGLDLEIMTSPYSVQDNDERGMYTEEAIIWGPSRNTPELHNVRCGAHANCRCIADGKWCFLPTELTVVTPNQRWVFVPTAAVQIQCTRDNDGSCAWNNLGAPDRFFVTIRNPTNITATALTNSRSIGIRIGCLARYYP
jgi:hypothetical protein